MNSPELVVYCRFTDRPVARTQDIGLVQIDWDADETIVGVEILCARSVTTETIGLEQR